MELPIYLIGYMASGKTTVGKILANKLGWSFVDLDDAFEELYGYNGRIHSQVWYGGVSQERKGLRRNVVRTTCAKSYIRYRRGLPLLGR
jgi:shikimate kinase